MEIHLRYSENDLVAQKTDQGHWTSDMHYDTFALALFLQKPHVLCALLYAKKQKSKS